jgi:hypothetical protein
MDNVVGRDDKYNLKSLSDKASHDICHVSTLKDDVIDSNMRIELPLALSTHAKRVIRSLISASKLMSNTLDRKTSMVSIML